MTETKPYEERELTDRSLKHGIHKLIYGRDTFQRRHGHPAVHPNESTTLSLTKSEV
ncbi:hypothetical protein [Acanthopleuribacter pedis]|uniref:Uncharacterized protein n=1 Tax=Acanthopleuribacter pedis TaxID=442870 RepID=A0A8J7QTH8_9BACT|nr:hypothetical protein [Acanthopleuribacter pedis]MBO1323228.1 hypothetical protein [Acanthopleuribacter pedis]